MRAPFNEVSTPFSRAVFLNILLRLSPNHVSGVFVIKRFSRTREIVHPVIVSHFEK